MAVRIKDITTTASEAASDDYIAIDGATNGTRKISASGIGGATEYDFTSTLTPSLDSRGVSYGVYAITPVNATDLTKSNAIKIQAYLDGSQISPLIVTSVTVGSSAFYINVKSIYTSVQSSTSTTVTGTLHIVAPFEVSSVATSM